MASSTEQNSTETSITDTLIDTLSHPWDNFARGFNAYKDEISNGISDVLSSEAAPAPAPQQQSSASSTVQLEDADMPLLSEGLKDAKKIEDAAKTNPVPLPEAVANAPTKLTIPAAAQEEKKAPEPEHKPEATKKATHHASAHNQKTAHPHKKEGGQHENQHHYGKKDFVQAIERAAIGFGGKGIKADGKLSPEEAAHIERALQNEVVARGVPRADAERWIGVDADKKGGIAISNGASLAALGGDGVSKASEAGFRPQTDLPNNKKPQENKDVGRPAW